MAEKEQDFEPGSEWSPALVISKGVGQHRPSGESKKLLAVFPVTGGKVTLSPQSNCRSFAEPGGAAAIPNDDSNVGADRARLTEQKKS